VEDLESWRAAAEVKVSVRPFGAFHYVYLRIFEPYAGTRLVDAYHSLIAWLARRGTDVRDVVFIGMSLDDPSITPPQNCRYDLGIAFPDQLPAASLLGQIFRARGRTRSGPAVPGLAECRRDGLTLRDLEPPHTAAIHCRGDLGQVDRAWQYLYRVWLPATDFEPADLPAMEVFVRLPEEIGWETFDLQACLPVARL
jgi:DNA gyrase inhibitor GyrI